MQGSSGDTDIEIRLTDKGRGGEGEGEINGESSVDVYTLAYEYIANGNLLYVSGNSQRGSVLT